MRTRLQLIGVALCFAGTFTAGRVAAQELAAFDAAFWRFAAASLVLLATIGSRRPPLRSVGAADLGWFVLLAASGVVAYNVCFFMGLQRIEASRASLIIALNPVGIAVGAQLLYGERLSARQRLGLGLAVAGAVHVIVRGRWSALSLDSVGLGELWILGCVASWVTYSLAGRRAARRMSNRWMVTASTVLGALALVPPALAGGLEVPRSPGAWAAVLFLGVFGTAVAFLWYQAGIRELGPARAGAFICLIPPFGAVIAAVVLGEALTRSVLVGAGLVAVGLVLAQRVPSARRA